MIYPLVAELADGGVPVAVTCRVLKIARQPYYRWKQDPVAAATWVRAHRLNALHSAHQDDPTFGYRFLAGEARKAAFCRPATPPSRQKGQGRHAGVRRSGAADLHCRRPEPAVAQ
jgi:hypothetical protein